MNDFDDGYQKGFSIGYISSELRITARILILLHKRYTENEPEKLDEFITNLPKQSMGFLQEALENIKQYPGYSINHQCSKAIFEGTWMPYNFVEYEKEKEKFRKSVRNASQGNLLLEKPSGIYKEEGQDINILLDGFNKNTYFPRK